MSDPSSIESARSRASSVTLAPRRALAPPEHRRRRRELAIGGVVAAAIAGLIALERRLVGPIEALPVADSALFLFLNAVNAILIVLLVFLIARNLVKLVFERRSGILGAHLNAKFVVAFGAIALAPTVLLFGVAAFFLTASIDAWFSLKVDQALERSREIANEHYDSAARGSLAWGRRIADQITAGRLLREEERERLGELVHRLQREYNLGVVEVFSGTGEELVTAVNPEIPAATFSQADSDLVRAALAGGSQTRVVESGSGDVIRGAVPVLSSFRANEAVGAVVVNYFVPVSLARKVEEVRLALDEYRNLRPSAAHVRTVYLMELLLAFLVILLLATWWGFRLAKSVTDPIGALAAGTEEVARGNLDVQVEATSDDEIGLLVRSFNSMTRDLREARADLERSNVELDRRRHSMEIVLRSVSAGVVSVDGEGRIGTLNPSAQRLLGLPPGTAFAGRKLDELPLAAEHLEVVRELSSQLRPGLRETIRRQVRVTVHGDVMTLLVTLGLLRDEEGRAPGMLIVYDDFTQLVKAERMEAWREVARRIAHEIKNPLTPIALSAQRLRRRFRDRVAGDPDDARVFDECVSAISGQVESLKLLVDEFSNFARLPAANPKPDDPNALVAEVVASYQGTENVAVATRLDPAVPWVELDREQIRRVLTNLIDNAIAAVREAREHDLADPAPGRVEIRTVHDAPLAIVRLEVADDGVGIRPEDRLRIFEPYFSTKRQGTGLGLAIVARIVADHRGYVRVHDRRPRGTTVVVEIPVRA